PHALVFHQLHLPPTSLLIVVFFFIDTAATVLYTLSLHDALPICEGHADRVLLVRRRRHRVGLEVVDHAGQVDAAAVCPVGSFAQGEEVVTARREERVRHDLVLGGRVDQFAIEVHGGDPLARGGGR